MGKGKSMGETFRFDYYYGIEAEQFSFYRVPRILIKDKKFKNLSSDAKLLYGLMLDRMSLSMKNGWLDAENKVYIYYTMENIMDDLSCAKATAVKVLAELDVKKGIGLVEKKRQGLGRPDIIYVKNFATVEPTEPPKKEKNDKSEEDASKGNSGTKIVKLDETVPKASNYRNSDKSNANISRASAYGSTYKYNEDVSRGNNYGNSDKFHVDMPMVSGYRRSDKSEADAPRVSGYKTMDKVHSDMSEAGSYEKADIMSESLSSEVERADLYGFENNTTENLEIELAEVQNLDFKEWEDYLEEKNCKETYVDDYECFAEFGLKEENTFEFSKLEEPVAIADCECLFSYETKQTKERKDDALSESEIAFLRQLGIENPQEIAHETISIHGEEKETNFTYLRYDISYKNLEMEYSDTQNLTIHEYMQENTNNLAVESSEIQDFGFERLDICRSSEIELQEVQNLDFRKFERQNCRSSEVELQEVKELNPNYIDNNYTNKSYTEMSYTNLIYPIYQSDKKMDRCDGLDESSAYISLIKKNLEYDLFMQDKTWNDRELYEELFQIICDVVCVKRKSVRVSGENYPYELVKSKFLKLNSSHLTYVIDCMRKTVSKIGNIKAYMITALYNAGNTISHYYQQAVQHDMYGGGWQEAGIV